MPQATIEERLNRLEKLVENVLDQISEKNNHQKNWRKTVGMFDGDPIMKEVIDGALQAREEERLKFYEEFDKANHDSP